MDKASLTEPSEVMTDQQPTTPVLPKNNILTDGMTTADAIADALWDDGANVVRGLYAIADAIDRLTETIEATKGESHDS
ncbi:MAG: hypothetical protein GY835_24725 [bacterium]|nr:hypothetical protein [bacterium]